MARYGLQANSEAYYGEYADPGRESSFPRSRAALDRSDAMTYYGGLFSNYRAGSSVYGGLLDDAPLPAPERRHERRRKTAADHGVRIGRYSRPAFPHISSAEKSIMIFVAVFISALFIGVIALEAYSVSIQHEVNKIGAETASIQKEIDELYVSIEQGNNIAAIEDSAKKKLEMRYPSSEQLKYEKDIKVKDKDANIIENIRSKAYGK
ncbi:MAG: cell division protein FtsL [Clostridiales Family XIII bacterium]|jgi:cell division protein FtsL|nr:cell division protein FtsL [Clostridiales Family XIII bacterium]